MKVIFYIAQRDIKSLVFHPLALILAGIFSILWNLNFYDGMKYFASASANSKAAGADGLSLYHSLFLVHFSYYNIIALFLAPTLTMKLLVEEKRAHTYDLLMTAPVTSLQIALGKFFAGWVTSLLFVILCFAYPLSVLNFTSFNIWPLVSGFMALSGLTAIYVAVGLLCSALTRSLVLAVILGVFCNLSLWFLGQIPMAGEGIFALFWRQFSLPQHYQLLLIGKLKISSLIYFMTTTGLFIVLTQKVIETARWRYHE